MVPNTEYINGYGGRYKVLRVDGGDLYQVVHLAKNANEKTCWTPVYETSRGQEVAQAWLDDLAATCRMKKV